MKITFSLAWLFMLIAVALSAQKGTDTKEIVSQAEAYIQTGNYTKAIEYCTANIISNPEAYYCYGLRGIAHFHKTNAAHAYEDLSIALQHFPTERFFYYRSRTRNRNNYKGIFQDLSEAIAINPNNPRYFYDRGQVQWKAFIETATRHNNFNLEFVEKRVGFTLNPCPDFEQATALSKEYGKTLELCERFQVAQL